MAPKTPAIGSVLAVSLRGLRRRAARAGDHNLRRPRGRVRRLHARQCGALPIEAFRIARAADFERRIDMHFAEARDALAGAVAVALPICGRIEYDGATLDDQRDADVG